MTSSNVVWHESEVPRDERWAAAGVRGATVWLTGLSGSGKSTVASALSALLTARGILTYTLDGDNLRHGLNGDLGFSAADRAENVRRVGEVARLFADAGVVTIVPLISPYRAGRDHARALHAAAGLPFFEVFVDTPIEVCETRDPKGLYAKARAGEITGFTGIDDPYEAPTAPELVLEAGRLTAAESAAAIVATLEAGSAIPGTDRSADSEDPARAGGSAFADDAPGDGTDGDGIPVRQMVAPVIRTRSALDVMPEYVPGRSAESVAAKYAIGDVVKLASNEAPFPPLPSALAAIADAASGMNRYPDDSGMKLRGELAAEHGVTPDQVLLGNGSVELCRMALAATCDPGDEVIFGRPSFEAYPILAMQVGARMVQVPLTETYRYDLDAMADAVSDRTRLVFVDNPNNPTGTAVDRDAVDRFLERVPRDLLVVFDEAYREFVTAANYADGLDYVEGRDNVCVLLTFSKAYGLAALRVGYAIAHESVISALRKVRVPFEVNALAQVAASASLAAQDEMRQRVAEVVAERTRVFDAITDLGLPVVPSEANFVWLPIPDHAAVLGEYSERAGVVLRPFPGVGVRVTIGTAAENDRLLKVLRAASEDGAAG